MNLHKIAVIDFETTGINPDTCEPTQLAAVMVDPRKLEIIEGSEFNTLIIVSKCFKFTSLKCYIGANKNEL